MQMNENDKRLKKKLYIIAAVAFAVLYSLNSFIIEPFYISALYNIEYDGSVLLDVLDYLSDIVEMLALSLFYAVLAYAMYRLGNKKVRGMILLFIAANMYKYTCNVIMTWVDEGRVPLEWYIDLLNAVFFTAAEMISFAIVWLIMYGFIQSYRARQESLIKVGKSERVFPLVGIYNKKNCLMNSALWTSVAILILKLFGQLINDIVTVKEILNVHLMLLSYGSNIIFGILCYFTMILTLITLDEKLGKSL